jgi:acetoin:2,6-dichlorophenolindophenol oxidoreductase subunit alpha
MAKRKNKEVSFKDLLSLYRKMVKIRKFEEKVGRLVFSKEIKTPCHLYIGQEAIAAGVCLNLKNTDYIFGNHRNHGHFIAKGGDIKKLACEIFCKISGTSKGKGGSMHTVAPEVGFLGAASIVAASIPIAVGAGLACQIQKKRSVSVSFFGEGAVSEGIFYESLNFAALKKLPVIFVCEKNLYSTHMRINQILADTSVVKKAESLGVPGVKIDGNNVFEVYRVFKKLIEKVKQGNGPVLIEAETYRYCGHVGPDDNVGGEHTDIRPRKEFNSWKFRDPIKRLARKIPIEKREKIGKEIDREIESAFEFAKKSPFPQKSELKKDVFKL